MGGDNAAQQARLHKAQSPGLQVVTFPRPSCEEIFIIASPINSEPPESIFERAASVIRERNARVVSQEVFGLCNNDGSGAEALQAALGEITWPVTWVESGARQRVAGSIIWAVAGPTVEPLRLGDRLIGSLFQDDHAEYCRLGGLTPEDTAKLKADQTRDVFALMEAGLERSGMSFDHVVRTWFCNDNILSWYDEFNKVRDHFFAKRGVFDGLVPASTGVGGRNAAKAALVAGTLAIKPKTDNVEIIAVPSPLQCPALEYGSSFSRAVEIQFPDHRRLLISGTASIAPEGHTVHVDDVEGQVDLTMRVAHAILDSRGLGWDDVSRGIAYFKHADDVTVFGQYCQKAGLPTLPVVLVYDDICRDDLLFEVEVDALGPSKPE